MSRPPRRRRRRFARSASSAAGEASTLSEKHVLVTGAAGRVAGRLLPALRRCYRLTLLDVTRETRAGETVEDIQLVDLLAHRELEPYRPYFQDVHTVIFYAISDNTRRCWGLANARQTVDYRP